MATQGRDIGKVIDAILVHIPVQMSELRARLERIKDDAAYLAPEVKSRAWHQLVNALRESCYNPPTLEWEKRVSAIIEGRESIS